MNVLVMHEFLLKKLREKKKKKKRSQNNQFLQPKYPSLILGGY